MQQLVDLGITLTVWAQYKYLYLQMKQKKPVNPVRYILVKIIVAIQLSCGDNILIVKKTWFSQTNFGSISNHGGNKCN